ncbi:MAG: DUF4428 domain-containing protein [Clostridium sp.]|nr:DUF4428 domain-containing protein [Clostridium sp.]
MGLFDKKYCDICGEKIGLLGNRKLQDGNLCKNCAAKLSPWFSERRASTVEDIKGQLAYREQNQQQVAAFNPTRSIGKHYRVLLDENAGKFLITNKSDYASSNPDVLDLSQVLDVNLDINESRTEKKESKDGKQVSYNPPRYEYSYNFYVTVRVNHPYFDDMKFMLSNGSVRTGEQSMTVASSNWRVNRPGIGLGANRGFNEYQEYVNLGNEIKEALMQTHRNYGAQAAPQGFGAGAAAAAVGAGAAGAAGKAATPYGDLPPDLARRLEAMERFQKMTPEEQQAYMLKAQEEAMAAAQKYGITADGKVAGPTGGKVTCPWCGAQTTPDAAGNCEFCGGSVKG